MKFGSEHAFKNSQKRGYSQKHILEHESLYINSQSREFLIHITISRMEEIMKLLEIEENIVNKKKEKLQVFKLLGSHNINFSNFILMNSHTTFIFDNHSSCSVLFNVLT